MYQFSFIFLRLKSSLNILQSHNFPDCGGTCDWGEGGRDRGGDGEDASRGEAGQQLAWTLGLKASLLGVSGGLAGRGGPRTLQKGGEVAVRDNWILFHVFMGLGNCKRGAETQIYQHAQEILGQLINRTMYYLKWNLRQGERNIYLYLIWTFQSHFCITVESKDPVRPWL